MPVTGDHESTHAMIKIFFRKHLIIFILLLQGSCKMKDKNISSEQIKAINLKRGEIVLCGPSDKQFGTVQFDISCSKDVKGTFNLAMALLHSFEYDEAEKVFTKIIDQEPGCAMAYWGVAMCNYHPLWAPPGQAELVKGAKVIELAESLHKKTERESGYIQAIAVYYKDWDKADQHTRCVRYEKAMEKLYTQYPADHEAAIFYALALDAAADPADKTFAYQKKAGAILNTIYPDEPGHPGIVHYIIHNYDYPGLAELALPAARKYASVAPASAHALHMPSHIFTRLGLWDECISSNMASTAAAKCYAENAALKGHWDEELHGMDYLVYAYLQKGDDSLAKAQWDYLRTIRDVYPANFKVAYAFAAIPARYVLENKMWKEAASLELYPLSFPWDKFPWQEAIIHFARLMGDIHTGLRDSAMTELDKLKILRDTLQGQGDMYKANEVNVQIGASEAWILFKDGKYGNALEHMISAADMEDATEKNPVTPGEVIPARELLADMLLEMGYKEKALTAFQEDLKLHPKRFNGLYGAGLASEKCGDKKNTALYYRQLSDISTVHSVRPELMKAKLFLNSQ
jgi:tetratricopeptide (TPR) repeat protein